MLCIASVDGREHLQLTAYRFCAIYTDKRLWMAKCCDLTKNILRLRFTCNSISENNMYVHSYGT